MVDVTPGDLGANKGFWMVQLRDRFGKFVEMGGSVMFDVQLEGVNGIVQGIGKFIGNVEPGLARIEVADNSRVPKGVYLVKSEDITAIEAVLPSTYVEEKLDKSPLKKKMTGSQALELRLRSMGNVLREDGRFPSPRMSFLDREDSDNRRAAKRDYKKVFDAEPALQEKYKTFENMWQTVYKYGTDERTQSPNALADIPEDMKELNRAYAKHFLGLEPDGLITVYRNAVNGKDTPEESAIGYASIDSLMAYDYNSHRDNVAANGRYEIDVKPDEVFGMLGYSKIEDEYGVTIGRELANIPGRVRRVGDLEMVLPDAPWLKEWALGFNRGVGASPFRQFSLAVSHDFHPVEPFGDSLEEFFAKYNLSAADIKNKYDEIYGEGAYEEYKATGNTVKFNKLRDLFVTLPDGRLGLDVKKVENLSALREVSEYKGDSFDNTMKMLSVFQELTGQYFMTHRTRDYTPPPVEAEQDSLYEEFFDAGNIDLQSLARSVDGVPKYDRDMFSDEQLKALETYGQSGYRQINKLLREEAALTADQKNLIKLIDEAIDENGALFSPGRVYRGEIPKIDSDYAKFLQNMEVGGTYRFPGYFSASNDAQIAFSEFGPGVGSGDSDGSATHLGPSFFWTVDVPEDGRAMAMPDEIGFGQGAESEVVFPRGSNLKILGIKKVEQIDDEGNSNGNFNYFIHAEQLPAPYLGEQGSSGNDSTDYASIDYETSEFKDVAELQVITDEDLAALSYYTGEDVAVYGVGYDKINEFLRNKEWGSDVQTPEEQQRILKTIETLKKIVNSTTIDKDIKVVRYQNFTLDGVSKPGDIWTSDGFLSTATMTDGGEEVYNAFTGAPVEIEINIPKGSRGGAVPDSVEAEVLLPPGSRFVVQSVEKVNFRETKIKLLLVGQDG